MLVFTVAFYFKM